MIEIIILNELFNLIVWFVRKIKVFLINNNTLFIMKKTLFIKGN